MDGNRVRCQVEPDELDQVLRRLSAAGLRTLVSQPPTLEELFLRHYEGDVAGRGSASSEGSGSP